MFEENAQLARDVYGLRKLAAMPFKFVVQTLPAALPMYLLFVASFLIVPVQEALMPGSVGTVPEKIASVIALALNVVSLCGVFALVLKSAADHSIGKRESSAMDRYEGILTIVGKTWPQFLGFVFCTFAFSSLFVLSYAAKTKEALDIAASADLSQYLSAFAMGLLEPFANPVLYGFGLLSVAYFGFYARRSISVFELCLSALGVRGDPDGRAAVAFGENKLLFVFLASLPHMFLGICILIAGMLLPKGGYDELISHTGTYKGDMLSLVLWTAVFCGAVSFIVMIHAAFISVIWMTAAERTGQISLEALDNSLSSAGASVSRAVSAAAAPAASAASRSFGQRGQVTLRGSAAVSRFGKR
jgi:hypothetical protein